MRGKIGFLRLAAIVLLATTGGCGGREEPQAVTRSPVGFVPAEPQRPGDPEAGYLALVNGTYVTCGIPYSAYRRTARPPEASQLLEERLGRNAELPYWLNAHRNADGVEIVSSNCLLCHAGYFDGKLVIGLGNEFLDFTTDPVAAAENAGAYVTGEAEIAAWRRWADRIQAVAPYTITDTVGVNPAVNLTLALMAHRDPRSLAWSSRPLLEPPPENPLPVSVPPWWRMGKKHALFYSTEGRGDHGRIMMLASTLCTDTAEEARRIDAMGPHIRAYLASLQPPAYPYAIDAERAQAGQRLFENHCSRCHGTYGADGQYPNRVIAYQEVGTDPELARQATGREGERFIRWFNGSFFGEIARAAPAPGYIAPPLDSVWATAPYLHNGSVPDVATLLDSEVRPRYWEHDGDAPEYDTETLGWRYIALDHGKAGEKDRVRRKRIYDTTLKGYSNAGHGFGDGLSAQERRAVIEYLKTL